jgi:hypothetical protein
LIWRVVCVDPNTLEHVEVNTFHPDRPSGRPRKAQPVNRRLPELEIGTPHPANAAHGETGKLAITVHVPRWNRFGLKRKGGTGERSAFLRNSRNFYQLKDD